MMRCVGYVTLGRYEYRTLDYLVPDRKVVLMNGLLFNVIVSLQIHDDLVNYSFF